MMGWVGGSEVLIGVAQAMKEQRLGPTKRRVAFYESVVDLLEGMGCDTIPEAEDIDDALDYVIVKRCVETMSKEAEDRGLDPDEQEWLDEDIRRLKGLERKVLK